jgi:hypothetical protein
MVSIFDKKYFEDFSKRQANGFRDEFPTQGKEPIKLDVILKLTSGRELKIVKVLKSEEKFVSLGYFEGMRGKNDPEYYVIDLPYSEVALIDLRPWKWTGR